MSHNRLVFSGMEELRAALRNLPSELAGEASLLVEGEANAAVAEMRREYPIGLTGNLVEGAVVSHVDRGKVSAGAIVKNTAKHAHLYEYGTQVRHTALGANRGAMPPRAVFVPAMVRARRRLYTALRGLLTRHGLLVTGDA